MKKLTIITIALIICFWSGVFFSKITKKDVKIKENDYIFMGKKESAFSTFSDSLREANNTPLDLYIQAKDIISSPEMAYAIADCILSNIYGRSSMDKEKPYHITLLDDRYWVVEGSLKTPKGGTAYIMIQKGNGQILEISHGK